MKLDVVIDLQEEREKRKQRRNHLNDIDEMIERIDSIRTFKDQTSLRMKRAASCTKLRNSHSKTKSVVKRSNSNLILINFLASILNDTKRS